MGDEQVNIRIIDNGIYNITIPFSDSANATVEFK